MTAGYHLVEAREEECTFCGEVMICAILVADLRDPETGNIDEVYLCRDCEGKHRL